MSEQPVAIYCGNNRRHPDLMSGRKVIGSRYKCFKKGFGQGLKEPVLNRLDEYEPIDQTRIYCGDKRALPERADRFGTPSECLRKGFGAAQKVKYDAEGVQRTAVILSTPSGAYVGGEAVEVLNGTGWYRVFLPMVLGPVAGIFNAR